jgi:hypothetical protein
MTMIADAAPAADTTAAAADTTTATPAAAAPAADATGAASAAAADSPEAIAAAAAAEAAKTPEQVAAEAEAALAAAGAPETYADFTPPEGAELDAGVMTVFAEAARELNLPQKAAQQLIDKMAPIMDARRAEQMQVQTEAWETAAKADPEFGGAKLDASKVQIARAMNQFATPELRTMLDETGLGNHPELVRFMVRAGQAISEERIITNGLPASTGIRSAADTLYPASSVKK